MCAGEVYSSYQADVIARMPKKELAAVLIKQQHNVASKSTDYPLRLPRIMHEYVVLWQKRHSSRSAELKKISVDTSTWVSQVLRRQWKGWYWLWLKRLILWHIFRHGRGYERSIRDRSE